MLQPTNQRIKDFEPALEMLQNLQPQDNVLLHCFSSGGATAAFQIAREYRSRKGEPLPISKVVLDSSPGVSGCSSTVNAFSVALRNNIVLWSIGSAFLRALFGVWFLVEWITKQENIVDIVRKGLNDEKLFLMKVARMYINSVKDALIRWQDVEAHADEAHAKGCKIDKVRYLDSVHAGHLFQDAPRYWGAVTRLWDSDYLSGPGLIKLAW